MRDVEWVRACGPFVFRRAKRKQVIQPKKEYCKIRHWSQSVTLSFCFISIGASVKCGQQDLLKDPNEKNALTSYRIIIRLVRCENNQWGVWVVLIYTSEAISIWSGKTGTWFRRNLKSGALHRLPTHNLNIWSSRRTPPPMLRHPKIKAVPRMFSWGGINHTLRLSTVISTVSKFLADQWGIRA